jgi:hypothetical protein
MPHLVIARVRCQLYKFLKGNIQQMRRQIQHRELCKTFQDAIYTTRRFKIQFFWIDSLCIIQDDQEDWQKESVQMSNIYGSSTLNIAASGAQDGSVGFFFHRNPLLFQPCRVKPRRFVRPNGLIGRICQLFGLNYDEKVFDVCSRLPLQKCVLENPHFRRAWTFRSGFSPH